MAELAAIILSLALLMYCVFRGYSIILAAPVFALMAASASNFSLMPVLTEIYMAKAAEYFKLYFSIFLLGAVFAKVMEDGGLARVIAEAIIDKIGDKNAIVAVLIGCGLLAYGGVSVFVVVFVMYPLAAVLYRQANIPKRFIPAALYLGTFTFSMAAFPGTPQIQNIIPTAFFGTTSWAAPLIGTISGFLLFFLGWAWLSFRKRQAADRNEGYGQHTANEPQRVEENQHPTVLFPIIPLVIVLVANLYLSNPFNWSWAYRWDNDIMTSFKDIGLINPNADKMRAIWSLNIALAFGIISALVIGRKQCAPSRRVVNSLNNGAMNSLVAVLNTASGYAYGSTIAALAGFQIIKSFLLSIQLGEGPLISEAITINILAAITASSSGGMTIALGMLGADYLSWAKAANIPPDALHRFAALASIGLDSMPHSGGLITILGVCGLTHRESYYDIFVLTLIKTLLVFILIVFYMAA